MAENEAESKSGVTVADILGYFMNLYKIQLGVPRDTPSKIVAVEPSRQYPKLTTYNLLVEYEGDPVSRRVTAGPIAEDTGSKSSCFLAIYESKLVIKIPPKPITDFNEYIRCIERDRQIVATLSPRVCLIPGVSMILDKIYKFPRINELKGDQREDAYLEWLDYNQEYQWCLKIKGSFAFFMDLSKYMFLSDVLPLFYGVEKKIQEEMTRDPSILESFERFEGRYGVENTQIGVDMKEIYQEYDEQLRKLLPPATATSSDMLYKMQHWFFSSISDHPQESDDKDIPEKQVAGFDLLIDRIVEENREVVDRYRDMIVDFLGAKRSFQNRRYKEGLVANILEMLAGVKEKGVAIRDIKPDNLLVAGDMDNYPAFLATPERFSIGLIDFETAVAYQPENQQEIEQPFLGGTSWYATPLHMFNNKTLILFYKDLPRAFYLQDWYSAVAMIYRIITGDHLFPKTSRLFSVAAEKLREAKKKSRPAKEVVSEINSMFWSSAAREFSVRMEKKKDVLQFLRPPLAALERRMCLDELILLNQSLDQEIKRLISRQTLFKSQENREQLSAVTPEQLDQLIKKAQGGSKMASQSLAQPVAQLKRIRKLKEQLLKNQETMNLIAATSPDFSVYDLLTFMFNRVVSFMNINPLKD